MAELAATGIPPAADSIEEPENDVGASAGNFASSAGKSEEQQQQQQQEEEEQEERDGENGEEEQQRRREAIIEKQREALAALRKAEEQDQLQLHAQTEDEHRRSVEEWDSMEAQVLEAAKMGKEHALLIALMNELKEKYEVVQRRSAEQLLTINSLESQTYALQANWEDAEERVRRAEGEALQLRDDRRQLQVRNDAALAVSREELRAAIEVQDRYAKTIETKTDELKQLDKVRETLQDLLVRSTAESAELQKLLEALRAAELRGVQVSVKPSEKLLGSNGGVPHVTYKFDVRLGNFQIHKLEQRYSAARTCFETLEERGVFQHMKPPLSFPSRMLLSDMTDSTNIAQRGEELRYYYQRMLGDPKLLCNPIVHEVLGIEKEQVDMATSASKMLLKVNVNTEMIQEVFDALPAKATQPVAAEESSWDDVLSSASGGADAGVSGTPPRQTADGGASSLSHADERNPGLPLDCAPPGKLPGTPPNHKTLADTHAIILRADGSSVPVPIDSVTGTPSRLRNPSLPAPNVTPSRSPAAATLEAAATLTPSRLPRDPQSGEPIALESDTQLAGPPQPLYGLEPEPEPEQQIEDETGQGIGSSRAAQKLSADLQRAKAEVKGLKSGLVEAEQRASDAQTSAELLHEELEKNRAELLKAWEETMALQQQQQRATTTRAAATGGAADTPTVAETKTPRDGRASSTSASSTSGEELEKVQEKVLVLEAQLEAGDAEIRRLEELLAAAATATGSAPPTTTADGGGGGGDGGSTSLGQGATTEEQQQQQQVVAAEAAGGGGGDESEERTLSVTNLYHKVREGEIKELFAAFGGITAIELVRDVPFSTATVEFEDAVAARSAVEELNGVEVGGAAVAVALLSEKRVAAAAAEAAAGGVGGLDDDDLAGLLASSEAEQAQQQQQQQQLSAADAGNSGGVSAVLDSPSAPSSSSMAVAAAAQKQRHAAEAKMLRSQLEQAEGEAELAKREAQMLRRQLGILRCQPENDEVATQLESEERQLETARGELRRLQNEAAAVEERLKMRRAGLDAQPPPQMTTVPAPATGDPPDADSSSDAAAPAGVSAPSVDSGAAGDEAARASAPAAPAAVVLAVPAPAVRLRSGSDARLDAVAAIELAQERSRNHWLEQELERLTTATTKDRQYFERQLAEFAGESSARLKQQKQAARLDRMRAGTNVTQYVAISPISGGGKQQLQLQLQQRPTMVRRFMRLSECGTFLLWGRSEADQKVMKVAIAGQIRSVEIGHKTSGWKSIQLVGGAEEGQSESAQLTLPPEWQCLSFVLTDASKQAMLLSADNDVDAALWCVGLRTILEKEEAAAAAAAAPAAKHGATAPAAAGGGPDLVGSSEDEEEDEGSPRVAAAVAAGATAAPEVGHPAASSSLFDLVRKRDRGGDPR